MAYTTRKTLLNRILAGDEVAWYEFYEQYHRLVFAIGKRWNLPEDQCSDLVQQVMVAVFQQKLTFRYRPELGKFRGFLAGITKKILLKMRQTGDPDTVSGDDDLSEQIPDREDTVFEEEWRKYLLDTMLKELHNTVDDSTFDAFQMYVLQGLPPEEIAETLKISVSSVYVYKKRCLDHLRHSCELLRKNDPEFKLL